MKAPPNFGRSVNSISISAVRADYAHQIPNTCTPGCSDLPMALRLHTTRQILFRRIEVEDVHWVLFLAEVSPTNQVMPATIG